ncbi:MAG: glycosyltransferase [Bacteroidia bacterium]|nr:glycosyltransferase [Bacteroidia bacterium]
MGFADHYISRHSIYPPLIKDPPFPGLNIIVVIPCYNEPELLRSLESLRNCEPPASPVEVIVVINSGTEAPQEALDRNAAIQLEAGEWMRQNSREKFRFHCLHKAGLPRKHAGVGLARKIGMDEAVYRFMMADNPGGIIVCFDADALCDSNYLVEIEYQFTKNNRANACSVYFEHPLDGIDFPEVVYRGIAQYELYLRYYYQALRFTGFPFAYHTVGSAFAVRAQAYVNQGGMNRKQAGEDFYFLQKIIPHAGFLEINTTRVIPSPRPSLRVPFGTGATIHKLLNQEIQAVETYHFQAFLDLKAFFDLIPGCYSHDQDAINELLSPLPGYLKSWLYSIDFNINLQEIVSNSSSLVAFIKRFYLWFNAFKIIKFLNYAHETVYSRLPVQEASTSLLNALQIEHPDNDVKKLLMIFRQLEKK